MWNLSPRQWMNFVFGSISFRQYLLRTAWRATNMSIHTSDANGEFHAMSTLPAYSQERFAELVADLAASHSREKALALDLLNLSQQQVMHTQEFQHRLINGMQLIVSLLSLQSRSAATPEAAAQLSTAARRVAALGRVHRQLHLLDHQANVDLKTYLQQLCQDLSSLFFEDGSDAVVIVEGHEIRIASATAIPLGFMVAELITNSAKYARGKIVVNLQSTSQGKVLSVTDDGPGLPNGFDVERGKGLGMKIIRSLAEEIGGKFYAMPSSRIPNSQVNGAQFVIAFK
jgi:two-component sensor histidine kinase